MRAIYYETYGDAGVLKFGEQPTPTVGPRDLLVRVRAAGVNPIDWKMRAGELRPMTAFRLPIVPGRDVAGEVVEIGRDVARFKVGDKVFGMLEGTGGGYAELAAIGEDVAATMPDELDFAQAAATPLAAITALQALRDHGELVGGERVLVNGASGGVGTFAVQIARALGTSHVVGVCGASHLDLVKSLGVDRAIDHEREDFAKATDEYDVIFDAVGKRTYAECKGALRHDGRYVTTLPDVKHLLGQALSIFTEKKMRTFMAKDRGEDLALIRGWLATGKVRPVIDKTFPLEQAADASRYGETGNASGKIVLTVA